MCNNVIMAKVVAAVAERVRVAAFNLRRDKTAGTYRAELRALVRSLYDGDIDLAEFQRRQAELIEQQYQMAWERGAAAVGFGADDIDPGDDAELGARIAEQLAFLAAFAVAIDQARIDGTPLAPLFARVDLWALRYDEVESAAVVHFSERAATMLAALPPGVDPATLTPLLAALFASYGTAGPRLVWRLGATEQHCATCFALDGTVATVTAWGASGLRPQAAPNPRLECGGWRCDCSLTPTDQELTLGGIPVV